MTTPSTSQLSQVRRIEIEAQAYNHDPRDDWQKLRDLVEAHLANVDRLNGICKGPSIDCSEFREAEQRYLNSQSDLFVAIEDTLCLPAEKLGRAIVA